MTSVPQLPLLTMLRERMSWLNQRQDLLSQNVANADTPGYVARDLKPLDFENAMKGAGPGLSLTNPRHIPIIRQASAFGEQAAPDAESTPNGNAVSLEQEMIKVSETQAQFQAAANLYAKAMTMMKTAIGH
jgi:flagellar basal-body rod protein FlgB